MGFKAKRALNGHVFPVCILHSSLHQRYISYAQKRHGYYYHIKLQHISPIRFCIPLTFHLHYRGSCHPSGRYGRYVVPGNSGGNGSPSLGASSTAGS